MSMIIGIDEVGRGPIAGPVCVCAFAMYDMPFIAREIKKISKNKTLHTVPLVLRDSKKLSKSKREAWLSHIQIWQKKGKCDFVYTMISAKEVDAKGILPSIQKALEKSLRKLNPKQTDSILLDGGLRAPVEFKKQKTIIKGDEKEVAIAFASIVAKVHRDKYMIGIAKKYPGYSFEKHVGYGTKAHYIAIRKFGRTPEHRNSFLTRFVD